MTLTYAPNYAYSHSQSDTDIDVSNRAQHFSKDVAVNSDGQQSRTPAALMIVCAALVIAGSLGPWARVSFITVSGTDGDGSISLFAGIVSGVAAIMQATSASRKSGMDWLALICLLGAFGVGSYDWANVSEVAGSRATGFVTVQVGWGLPILTFAGFFGAVVALQEIMYWGKRGFVQRLLAILLTGPIGVAASIVVAIRGEVPDRFGPTPSTHNGSWAPVAPAPPIIRTPQSSLPIADVYCRQCGTGIEPNDRHCGQCSAPANAHRRATNV